MADIFLGEFDVDILPPFVSNKFPVPGTTNVDLFTNVSFDIEDQGGSTVAVSSIQVTIDGQDAVINGSIQLGFGGSFTPIPSGFTIIIDPDVPLFLDKEIVVTVDARDQASIPNIMPTVTWSFFTNEGVNVSPTLSALSGDGLIQLGWSLPPPTQMLQELFQLRKTLDSSPVSPNEGDLIYEGTDRTFIDTDVENGTRYFYTVFVIRKFVSGVPEYVPYEEPASATAVPRAVETQAPLSLKEYVPARGEFGPSNDPLPHGRIISVWGEQRRQSTILSVSSGREVQAPVRGRVVEIVDSAGTTVSQRIKSVSIQTKNGILVQLSGFIPIQGISPGIEVTSGQVIGRTSFSNIEFAIFKMPTGTFGRRTIRPRYFYVTVENRDGRR
jgi:hypothetical protein